MNEELSDQFVGFITKAPSQYDSLCRQMAEEIVALRTAARNTLDGFDAGVFCRDISKDMESGWAIRALPYISALAKLKNLTE